MDQKYWQERWEKGDTPWDMGSACPALIDYCAQLPDKNVRILIPGAGSAHEADWLWRNGFSNVTVLDFSPDALAQVAKRLPDFPQTQLVQANFFDLQGHFDLILEQTFFCALNPRDRNSYALKMFSLLNPSGKLAGLLFNFPLADGPPYGGELAEYRSLFSPLFEIEKLEPCYNSIKPREGRELFFIFKKLSLGI